MNWAKVLAGLPDDELRVALLALADDRAPECQRWISKKYDAPYLVYSKVRAGQWPVWLAEPSYNRARLQSGEVVVLDPPVRKP